MNPKSVLYIAFHYPPILESSGVLRSLAFTRHLSENDWHTTVLSASLTSYKSWSNEQLTMLPPHVEVIRAFGRNSAKSFSIKGRYFAFMAQPDNWQSWIVGGVISGLIAIGKQKPAVIVSTYPIASAHIIGYLLHRLSGIPWVADFRDPMLQDDYPARGVTRRIFSWIERKAVKHCQRIIVTTKGTQQLYQQRFFDAAPQLFTIIPNGYDALAFEGLTASVGESSKTVILHSGVIYPSERDPSNLFQALAQLKHDKLIDADTLEIRLRASGHEDRYQSMLEQLGISDIVTLKPIIPYREALQEMLSVDGLLLIQAANCNLQIPAKVYEYICVKKPILGLMPLEGDTGQLVSSLPQSYISPLDDSNKISSTLMEYLTTLNVQSTEQIDTQQYSRQSQAVIFEQILEQAIMQAAHKDVGI